MTTPASADPGVSVTLYKAVTATVTWEQVRAAAKSMGMRLTKLEGAEDIEAWVHDSGRRVYIGGDADDMGHEIETLARIAGTSPGEMLERIAGPKWQCPARCTPKGPTEHADSCWYALPVAKAWSALHGERVASVIVETPSVEEPDAGPYDDRCRWVLGNCGARCRYVFDHHKRGVPCAARTSAAPPVADASAKLRARLVAELHAAGKPKLADRMSVDVGWRSLVDFVNPEILDMLSESLRKDLKTEEPK